MNGGLLVYCVYCLFLCPVVFSHDVIIPDAEVQVSVSGDESLSDKNQKKEIYSKKAVAKAAQPEEKEFLETATAGN